MSRHSHPHFLEPLLESPQGVWQLTNERTGSIVASEIEMAIDSASRNRGLLGRSSLAPGAVMIIAPCNAIHMFFMRFTIDVVFVDRSGRVLRAFQSVRPWRIRLALKAFAVLELPEGTIERADVMAGDRVVLGARNR